MAVEDSSHASRMGGSYPGIPPAAVSSRGALFGFATSWVHSALGQVRMRGSAAERLEELQAINQKGARGHAFWLPLGKAEHLERNLR